MAVATHCTNATNFRAKMSSSSSLAMAGGARSDVQFSPRVTRDYTSREARSERVRSRRKFAQSTARFARRREREGHRTKMQDLLWQPVAPPVRCGLPALVRSSVLRDGSLAGCTTLDLQGGALASGPVLYNTSYSRNETLSMLVEALADGGNRTYHLDALLLTGSIDIADDGVTVLGSALGARIAAGSGLSTLALDACNITSSGVEALVAGALRESSPLRVLSLSRNAIGPVGAAALAAALVSNAMLTSLHLSSSDLGSEGAMALASSLEAGGASALERLTLDQNHFGDGGAQALANALAATRHNSSLTALDLSGNLIGVAGVAALARALLPAGADGGTNVALRALELNSNDAGGEGAAALASALRRNSALRSLSLHDNVVTRDGGDQMERALRQSRGLTDLPGLRSGNDVPLSTALLVESAVARNEDAHTRGGRAPLEARPPATKR